MNYYLVSAAVISILTGVVHSVFGEKLIFIELRKHHLSGKAITVGLGARQVGILWATWHLASVLCFCLSGILYLIAANPESASNASSYLNIISAGYLISSILVLYGTKGKHPGWISLGAVALLTFFAF